jgi:hypothetical protein
MVQAEPAASPSRSFRLTSIRGCRRELSAVYAAARTNIIPLLPRQEGSRCATNIPALGGAGGVGAQQYAEAWAAKAIARPS